MSNTARGLLWLIPFVILVAATDVYAGFIVQSVDPVTVAAVSFTIAAAMFVGTHAVRARGIAATVRPWRTHRRDVVMLNVMTATTWLTLLYSLKYLEPAVVSVISFAIGPAVMVLVSPLLRRGSQVLGTEIAVSAAILVLIGVLGWGSLSGRSGIGALPTGDAVVGLALGLVCGLAYAGTVIYSKRLSDGGLSPLATLSVRYFLIIAVTWGLTAFADSPGIVAALLPGAALALVGVALQSYLGQAGIKYVEPITASLLDTLSPVCAFLLQFLDGRLAPSALTLACIVAITALVAVGVLARHRHESGAGADIAALPLPADATAEPLPRSA